MAGKPIITANQVTLLRLALISLPGWLIYQGKSGQYAAVIVGTILGCTDFVDGYLARKHGPTVLGGLMDPIADKVFIAIAFIPALDMGWMAGPLIAALFVREFLVTAARTCYERRGTALKSSYLSRYKTWVQMIGIGMLVLFADAPSWVIDTVFAVGALLPVVSFAIYYLARRRRWKGATFFAVSFAGFFIVHRLFGTDVTRQLMCWYIVGITWASGLGYLLGVGQLRGKGAITVGETVRLVTSLALPALVVAVRASGHGPVWALIALLSFELAHGGLDNLLAHHRAEASAAEWGLRLGLECALLAYALVGGGSPTVIAAVIVAAFGSGAIGLGYAFWVKRRYYLDPPSELRPSLPVPRVAVQP